MSDAFACCLCGQRVQDGKQSLFNAANKDGDDFSICNFCVVWALGLIHFTSNTPQNPPPSIVVYRGDVSMRQCSRVYASDERMAVLTMARVLRICRNGDLSPANLPGLPRIDWRNAQCICCMQEHRKLPLLVMGKDRQYLCKTCIEIYAVKFGVQDVIKSARGGAMLGRTMLEIGRIQDPSAREENVASTPLCVIFNLFARELV